MLIAGIDKKDIAGEIGISVPALNNHYLRSGSKKLREARRRALAEERSKMMVLLDAAAVKGNVSAIK